MVTIKANDNLIELNQFIPTIQLLNANSKMNEEGVAIILEDYLEIKVQLPNGIEANFTI